MNDCSCYHTRTDIFTGKTGFGAYKKEIKVGECWGTKEREECSCGGDTSKCDFYPEKRGESKQTPANPKIIAVDFDGTLCEDKWPEIGEPNQKVIDYIQKQYFSGAKIILWTCREGQDLVNALVWCMRQGLIFDAVNENLPEIIDEFGSDRRKIFAHEYLDDKALRPESVWRCE